MADRKLSAATERRVQLGLAVQPLVAALVGFVLVRVVNDSVSIHMAFVIAAFIGIAGVVITVCLAYPAFLWLLRRGHLVAFVDVASVIGSIAGATSAAVFWWIAVRHIDMEHRACAR
jgi:hypothetical protein